MKRFSDFSNSNITVTGEKIKIENVLDKEIEVINYSIEDSKFKKDNTDKLLTLQFKLNREEKILFTGSKVLIDQIEKYKDELPFIAIIKKINKFYTFT